MPNTTHERYVPRTIHGFYEVPNPRSQQIVRYYPYRHDLSVDGKFKPTVTQAIQSYFPKFILDDDTRVKYVSEKTGQSADEVAKDIFKMRKIKMLVAQAIRTRMRGTYYRLPFGDLDKVEKEFCTVAANCASELGQEFWCGQCFDPYVLYSSEYDLGDHIDIIMNKPLRDKLMYCLVEIVVHKGLAQARFPDVVGPCKEPLEDMEPSTLELTKLKMACMALIYRKEQYVIDCILDGGHSYRGMIFHIYHSFARDEVLFNIKDVELDLKRAKKFLDHWAGVTSKQHGTCMVGAEPIAFSKEQASA
jgi:hypothetical protein